MHSGRIKQVVRTPLSHTRIRYARRLSMDTANVLGRFIVADPEICHGKLTFRGTRIFVADVLEQVASGMDWESISQSWDGKVKAKAIAEAIRLAAEALEESDLSRPKA